MKNRWKCAVAYLFVMVLLAGFAPIQNTAINRVNAVSLDSSADVSGDVTTDVSSDASSNASGDVSSDASGDITTNASADVSVTIGNKGEFAIGEDEAHTLMVRVPVHVTDVDEDGALTFNDVMIITHNQYCKDGYNTTIGDWGLSVSKLWGDESFNFGYYVDNQSAMNPKEPIGEGSNIVAFIHKVKNPGQYDNYASFNKKEASVKADEAIALSLTMQGYDENWNVVTLPLEGAELGLITVSSGKVQFTSMNKVTDASGNATISFDKPGTYVVSAREAASADAAIVPPVCMITVEEKKSEPAPQPVPQPDPGKSQQGTPQQGTSQTGAEDKDNTQVPATVSEPDAKALALQKTKQKISTVKSKKAKQVTVTFKKDKKATKYQIQYSTSKKFTKKTTKSLYSKKPSCTIKKLKSKKSYYVRVRSVRTVNGNNYYGKYSTAKKIVVK
ncbi:MAG: hypothetical protein J6D02_00955 [Lachnospira sp.]|nr:hypothetical protein [Lachnospira sp.]